MGRQKTKVRHPAIKDIAVDVLDHVDIRDGLGEKTTQVDRLSSLPRNIGREGGIGSLGGSGADPPAETTQDRIGVVIHQDGFIITIGDGEVLDHGWLMSS